MADSKGTIQEDVARQMTVNLMVFDADGHRIGTVGEYNVDAEWMTVTQGPHVRGPRVEEPLMPHDLYIPFRLITTIDPREIYLSLPKDVLQRDYSTPPARTTVVETADDLGVVETIATTTEPSGYDGTPVVVERTRVEDVQHKVTARMRVYTATGERIGTITHYDPADGWMQVETGPVPPQDLPTPPEKGPFTRQHYRIPVAVVDAVNSEAKAVYLTVSRNDVQRLSEAAPAVKV